MPVLELDGVDLQYEARGNGPPMLLIAGTACDGSYWARYQVPDFARDHTVITFDQRGTGRTVTRVEDYATSRLAADAAALIAKVGLGPATVVGHSMGGRVAQYVALDHEQHVRNLVLASTGSSFKAKGGISPKTCLGILRMGYVGASHGCRHWTQIAVILAVFLAIGVMQWPLVPVVVVMAPLSVAMAWMRRTRHAR